MSANTLQLINQNINVIAEEGSTALLQSDEAYISQATPLKSAEIIKQQEKQELKNYLSGNKLKAQFDQALNVIYEQLPQKLSPEEWEKITEEIFNCESSLNSFLKLAKVKSEPIYLQEILGLSDDTCFYFYDLAMDLFKQSNYEHARCIMELLVNLAPYSASFWLSYAYCHQMQNQLDKAVEVYHVGQHIHPKHIPLFLFSADCHILLKRYEEAYQELQTAKIILKESGNKKEWQPKIKGMETILKARRSS